MLENNSQPKELQKELSKKCGPIIEAATSFNATLNRETLDEFWKMLMKFVEENGMTVEDLNHYFVNDEQRITFNGTTAIVAQYERLETEIVKPFENGHKRTAGPDRILFRLNGARYRFYDKGAYALTLSNIEDFKAVHTCEYVSLKNVISEAAIALPFNQQSIMLGKHEAVSWTHVAYSDMTSTTYREQLMGQLLPLVKESLLTIQKFIHICKKIVREREIGDAGKDYVS